MRARVFFVAGMMFFLGGQWMMSLPRADAHVVSAVPAEQSAETVRAAKAVVPEVSDARSEVTRIRSGVASEKQMRDAVNESLYARCLRKLPKTLKLPAKAPETMRLLVPKENFLTDYEPLIGGAGWGASLKYHNTSCEVVVYAYDKEKDSLTDKEAQTERQLFDGFPPESVFKKEVGDFIFYGTAGISPLDTSDKQVQMFSIAAVHNTFIKYRTVCRHLVDLPDEANYRVADIMTSQVIKETLIPLDNCLAAEKAASKLGQEEI